ncbi:hypothetical protein AZI86_12975 [Bdellovibrio bacteriovorus]|uniref:Uncharacterized protein n=2 Tax=Bdellovibrio bacteriovorus TaxID=959 RepID=A0A150WKM5_BDEBC|nr:hypothetical protein AZI86_12975 [Bdellovibrio bacteriovorus]
MITFVSTFILSLTAEARMVRVSGSGAGSSYCNANSGSYCIDSVKRRAEQDAGYAAERSCEFTYRGRALRYTTSYSTSCNPSYLPPRHDGTWVRCNSNSSMQCEVQ